MQWLNHAFEVVVLEWGLQLLQGALVTLQIAAGAFAIGMAIGVLVAMVKLSGPRPLIRLADLYTTLCRAIPELLLILLLYYAGSDLINFVLARFGQEPAEINGFFAAVVVLGIVQGAYAGEIIRGAIQAIPSGHIEAARAFGCRRTLILRRIILPEMLPYAIGGLSNLWLVLIKDSALISIVGYSELLFTTKQAAGSTREYLLFYLSVSALYLLITLLSNLLFSRIDHHIARWMPAH
ncbi:ABC transporter permease [Craterilacuibacter sinensis]|uniref:ABC transporter permease subunit n=1 Tax=Craterilacuibacter sinensis TaxID=2686017 RepID=A0A845BMP0_9NEIS|nr:ABC transporter permease subunit [Craterilacuibacter sinensis]MXR37615.1 ABC transporter permease subunit [Craterilacuibacter sinensis]